MEVFKSKEEYYIKNKDWKGLAALSVKQLKAKRKEENKQKENEYLGYFCENFGPCKRRTRVKKNGGI